MEKMIVDINILIAASERALMFSCCVTDSDCDTNKLYSLISRVFLPSALKNEEEEKTFST